MHPREAHTAEHIFAGSLQKIVGNLFVRKVEHKDLLNRVYIKSPELNLDSIYEAELMVNKIIGEGRKVKEHNFSSIEEAKKIFPSMRAYEERISDNVRVIEVDGYDYAACAKEHSENTLECGFFVVTHVSRERDEHEIEFAVGDQAKLSAIEMSMKCIRVTKELGASASTLEATARNMKNDLDMYRKRLSQITEQIMDGTVSRRSGGRLIYANVFSMLDDSTIVKKAVDVIKSQDSVVAFVNINSEKGTVILACNEKLQINCNTILKSVLGRFEGKGGGRRNFATGYVHKDRARETFDALLKELNLE